jgi:hypothetical protein
MPFKYACFISYRHSSSPLAERFVDDFYRALSAEMDLYIDDLPVFRDRAQVGPQHDLLTGQALCRSVCMAVIFTPNYFSLSDLSCAREFLAMERLQEERRQALEASDVEQWGAIIPVVLRGSAYLPRRLREYQYLDFESLSLTGAKVERHPRFASQISRIARVIVDRYNALRATSQDLCSRCESFTLPTDEEVRSWLEKESLGIRSAFPFPGIGGAP